MSRQVSYSLAVKGNNIAKGSVMLILANLNATTIHFLLSSRNIMAVLLRTKNVPTREMGSIIVSTQSQSVRKIDWPKRFAIIRNYYMSVDHPILLCKM